MYLTVFVDEFYYEKDPISGEEREGLWKEFVNQPNRLMHILCDNMKSFDKESSATGSVITLRQRSIQTPYNLENASTAWGCETVDEFRDSYMWYFSENETSATGTDYYGNPAALGTVSASLSAKGNTSMTNGLSNTVKLLGLHEGAKEWSTYLDFSRPNDYMGDNDYCVFFMKNGYKSLLYSILQRNRDNDGDGYIDPEEIRWYQTAVEQLYGLFMGGLGLSDDAQIYPPSVANATGTFKSGHKYENLNKWMLKVVSSTCTNNDKLPIAVWAEEGVSTSYYKREYIDWGTDWYGNPDPTKQQANWSPYSIRCARNLGVPLPKDYSDIESNEPDRLINVSVEDGVLKADLRRISEKSVRFYTTKELEPGDEQSEMSRLYYGLETGEEVSVSGNYDGLKTMLEAGKSPCPEGWRTPNVREGALMYLYGTSDWWKNWTMVNSWISLGSYGSNKKEDKKSWVFGKTIASIGETSSYVRCVKDSHPATW